MKFLVYKDGYLICETDKWVVVHAVVNRYIEFFYLQILVFPDVNGSADNIEI